jgi:hypothetical protein
LAVPNDSADVDLFVFHSWTVDCLRSLVVERELGIELFECSASLPASV